MSRSARASQNVGRTKQKLRTRRALLLAAKSMIDNGQPVTLAAVAEEALVSVATAYRYFEDVDSLYEEALLDAEFSPTGDVQAELVMRLDGISNVVERVLVVTRYLLDFTRSNEMTYRLFLSKSMERVVKEAQKPTTVRGARRIPMLEEALTPVRDLMSSKDFDDLVLCIAGASGVENYIALKDVCGLDDESVNRIHEQTIRMIMSGIPSS